MKIAPIFGNPDFLAPYWSGIGVEMSDVPTSYHFGGLPSLIETIKLIHKRYDNAEVEGKHIVVGIGATQLIGGLMHILGKSVWAQSPYFMRFPQMADQAGAVWDMSKDSVQIITCPNNPDNSCEYEVYSNTVIYDLSYNWPTYGQDQYFDEDIMIFSLAKATGHASSRIGWAILKDEKLAQKLRHYVEINTSGISIEAQILAEDSLRSQLHGGYESIFEYGYQILKKRWGQLLDIKTEFSPLNRFGMFLYAEGPHPRDTEVLTGEHFGDTPKHWRINMGMSEETWLAFLDNLR